MIVSNPDEIMCENRNAELLIQEIYRFDSSTKFVVVGDTITEHEALALYYAVFSSDFSKKDKVYLPMFSL